MADEKIVKNHRFIIDILLTEFHTYAIRDIA